MSTATALRQPTSSPCPSVSSVSSVVSSSSLHMPHLPHTPHTAHPIPLREQAFTLHCEGLRSPAIAAELGVSARTIRAWIAAALAELKDDLQLSRKEQLLLAVERQHQLTATAWQQFHHEAAARDAILDAALDTLVNAANHPGESASVSTRPLHLHLPASTPAPRYLSLILQANKETNRLLGLHILAKLQLLTPEPTPIRLGDSANAAESPTASGSPLLVGGARGVASDHREAERVQSAAAGLGVRSSAESATAITDLDIPAESATSAADSEIPAESATAAPTGLAAGIQPANPRPPVASPSACPSHVSPHMPAESATAITDPHIAAESATDPTTPYLSVNSVFSVVNRPIPAESATAIVPPLSSRERG